MHTITRQALRIQVASSGASMAAFIPERAREAHGVSDLDAYCDLIDREATAHICKGRVPYLLRMRATRRPKVYFDPKLGLPNIETSHLRCP